MRGVDVAQVADDYRLSTIIAAKPADRLPFMFSYVSVKLNL